MRESAMPDETIVDEPGLEIHDSAVESQAIRKSH